MQKIQNYVCGEWVNGEGEEWAVHNAITGEDFATVSSKGIDFEKVLTYGRENGSTALRKMTFQERGRMLKALAPTGMLSNLEKLRKGKGFFDGGFTSNFSSPNNSFNVNLGGVTVRNEADMDLLVTKIDEKLAKKYALTNIGFN